MRKVGICDLMILLKNVGKNNKFLEDLIIKIKKIIIRCKETNKTQDVNHLVIDSYPLKYVLVLFK
jgi:hypothetical protein